MGYKFCNPNPDGKFVDDCVFRALSIVLGLSWDQVAIHLLIHVLIEHDRADSNLVWGMMLEEYGFTRHSIPDTCPDCYTIRQFVMDHPKGTYVLATGNHVVALIDGTYYDTLDTGDYIPVYYWKR